MQHQSGGGRCLLHVEILLSQLNSESTWSYILFYNGSLKLFALCQQLEQIEKAKDALAAKYLSKI